MRLQPLSLEALPVALWAVESKATLRLELECSFAYRRLALDPLGRSGSILRHVDIEKLFASRLDVLGDGRRSDRQRFG